MPDYNWISVDNGLDAKHPDYVLPLTKNTAVWCMNNNGYDACLVLLKKTLDTSEITSRMDISSILHAVTAMSDHEPGYAPEDIRQHSLEKIRSYLENKHIDAARDCATWDEMLTAINSKINEMTARKVEIKPWRLRNEDGWMAELNTHFSVFVHEIQNTIKMPNSKLYEYQVLFGPSRKIVVRGKARTNDPIRAVNMGWDSLERYVTTWNKIYNDAAAALETSVLDDTPQTGV